MATTDTLVGIAGAVLLAGIMVSVFAYEYNNAPDDAVDPDNQDSKTAIFKAAYPTLNATEDIDQDGVPNYDDSDIDGNDVKDAEQSGNLRRSSKPESGTTPAPPATTYERDFVVQFATGNDGFQAWLNWSAAAPLPNLPTVPDLSLQLLRGSEVIATSSTTANGAARTALLEAPADAAGNYTLRVTMARTGPATPFTVIWGINYGPVHVPPVDTNPR